jgi:CheY-like chemotaxis protein
METDHLRRLANSVSKIQDQMERINKVQQQSIKAVGALNRQTGDLRRSISELRESKILETVTTKANIAVAQELSIRSSRVEKSVNPSEILDLSCVCEESVGAGSKPRVLVVEDDSAYQWLVVKLLEAKGVNCILAPTAHDALLNVQSGGQFDLVLMDIQLPGGINGLEAATKIRMFDRRTPIISMTGSTQPQQVASYYAGGMNGVLSKPFSKEELLNLVGKFCELDVSNDEGRRWVKSSNVEEQQLPSSSNSFDSDNAVSGIGDGGGNRIYTFGMI